MRIAMPAHGRGPLLTVATLTTIGLVTTGLLTASGASARQVESDSGAGSAQTAAATCAVKSVRPNTVVLGLSAVSPTWKVATTDCSSPTWEIMLPRNLGRPTEAAPKISLDPKKLTNSAAGTKNTRVVITEGPPVTTTTSVKITLKRRSAWTSVKASPQPVNGGQQLKITGTLKIADWTTRSYVNYRNRPVKVQFRAVGKSAWTSVKTVKTTSKGQISTSVKATADGSWRLHFAGTSVSSSANSTADYVEVITSKDRRVFANCAAMNAVYPHGVGRIGARDKVRGSADPVTNFVRNNHLYSVNDARDRDGDKIACEKR